MRGRLARLAVTVSLLAGCAESAEPESEEPSTWVYQLEGYRDGGLDELSAAPHDLAVIDLARDGGTDYFTRAEITELKDSGKTVLSYFSMGSTEKYRPESVPGGGFQRRVSRRPQCL